MVLYISYRFALSERLELRKQCWYHSWSNPVHMQSFTSIRYVSLVCKPHVWYGQQTMSLSPVLLYVWCGFVAWALSIDCVHLNAADSNTCDRSVCLAQCWYASGACDELFIVVAADLDHRLEWTRLGPSLFIKAYVLLSLFFLHLGSHQGTTRSLGGYTYIWNHNV